MDTKQLPDDLNPEVVKACAEFIGKITGLVPPPHDAFPPEWHGYLRTFTSRLYAVARENAATVAPAAVAPSDMRATFEAWWVRDLPEEYRYSVLDRLRTGDGYQEGTRIHDAWDGWKAHAALTPTVAADAAARDASPS